MTVYPLERGQRKARERQERGKRKARERGKRERHERGKREAREIHTVLRAVTIGYEWGLVRMGQSEWTVRVWQRTYRSPHPGCTSFESTSFRLDSPMGLHC
jgi:hypothetical protein